MQIAHATREIFSINVDGAWQPVHATDSLEHLVPHAGHANMGA
jgi:hypothetical protein